MTTIDGIPVYRVLVDDEKDGMVRVSLVDDPAVMSDFQVFDAQRKAQLFAIEDEEKRLVRGVVARADFPIYRRDEKLGEHYVIFPASTIREMAQKYLTEGRADNLDTMHDGHDEEDVHLVQWFIKDSAKGIAPAGFEDIADGSLFAEYHVQNDEVWQAVKDGTYKGFSMEVFYTLTPENSLAYVEEAVEDADGMFERIMRALHRKNMNFNQTNLLRKLGRYLSKFASVTTDKGVLAWDGDEDLKAGDRVYIEDADGNRTAAADGDYTTEDGKVIVVVDGAVTDIRDPEAEVAPAAEDPAPQEGAALSRHRRIRELFEASYEERYQAIVKALEAQGIEWPYIVEAGDTYAIVCVWSEAGEKYWHYDLEFDEAGECILGNQYEVKSVFVPVDEPAADPAPADPAPAADPDPVEDELAALRAENDTLRQRVEELSREPLAQHPNKKVAEGAAVSKTGNKRFDNLSRYCKK